MSEPEESDHVVEILELTNTDNVDIICTSCEWKYSNAGPQFVDAVISRHLKTMLKETK